MDDNLPNKWQDSRWNSSPLSFNVNRSDSGSAREFCRARIWKLSRVNQTLVSLLTWLALVISSSNSTRESLLKTLESYLLAHQVQCSWTVNIVKSTPPYHAGPGKRLVWELPRRTEQEMIHVSGRLLKNSPKRYVCGLLTDWKLAFTNCSSALWSWEVVATGNAASVMN